MARPSPEELRRARRAKQEERETMARRREAEKEEAERQKARLEQLVSITNALYEEMDKLNKKAPAMTLSVLSLDKVNKAIKAVKTLIEDEKDEFIDEINEFVPAGDMPEYRDVVLVLSQLKAGLQRFRSSHWSDWKRVGMVDSYSVPD